MDAAEQKTTKKRSLLSNFFLPKLTKWFFLRLVILVVAAYAIFGYFLLPCFISGQSMMPTYGESGFTFCWRLAYSDKRLPQYGDIVVVRYAEKVFLLKRVLGLPGDLVEFRNGEFWRNGEQVEEPYVKLPSDWNMEPRIVSDGYYFVVGDNRSMPIGNHKFGQVKQERIIGVPIW